MTEKFHRFEWYICPICGCEFAVVPESTFYYILKTSGPAKVLRCPNCKVLRCPNCREIIDRAGVMKVEIYEDEED